MCLKQVGDRVVALPEFRAWAELCAVPTKYVYKIPEEVSFQDAAAMAMNFLVAYIVVYDLLSLRAGKSVVLHSAGGGVVSIHILCVTYEFLIVQCPL
jgi:NADPH:quinone reductase-like Zn-dependent oxidoreductase